jgi:Flp pilus assembly protein TadG
MFKRLVKDDRGQMLVVLALSLALLLACTALAVDMGLVFRARRQMQIAADAGAVAGALDYKYNSSVSSAKTAAQSAALANGVSSTSYVTVNDPPVNGYHTSTGYTEVIVNQPVQTYFLGLFNMSTITVYARAVAGTGSNAGCIWALALSGTDVSLTGSGSITAQNCNIYDNSSATNALTLTGSGAITAKQIGIAGGYTVTGSGSLSPNPPTTGIAPAANPLSLTAPTISTGTCSGSSSACNPSNTGSGNMTLSPGTYSSISNTGSGTLTLTAGNYIITGNLTNTGSGSLVLGAGNYTIGGNFSSTGSSSITIGSGLYTVGGNLQLTGSGSMTGTGVTFYDQGSVTLTGSGNMDLTAPTSGTYSGVLVFEPASDTSAMAITGSGGDVLQGIVDAPDAPLTLTGSGSMSVSLDIIVDTVTVTGSGSITDTNYSVVTNTNSVLSKLIMVE